MMRHLAAIIALVLASAGAWALPHPPEGSLTPVEAADHIGESATVCVTGRIREFKGKPQIEPRSPSAITVED